MNLETIYFIIFILIFVVFGILLFLYFQKREKEIISKGLDMVLFLVMMPKYESKKEESKPQDEKNLIAQMEQIYTNFLNLKKPNFFQKLFHNYPRIALEIASELGGEDISFYVAVPKSLEVAFEKYVHGVYSDAIIEKIPQDYTIFEPAGVTVGSYLKLEQEVFFPINTYKNLEKDPLAAITNSLAKITANEGAAVQIIIRPLLKRDWGKIGSRVISKIKDGKSVKTAIIEASRSPFIEILLEAIQSLTDSTSKSKEKKEEFLKEKTEVNEKTIQSIQEKIQKQFFETNIRLIISSSNKERAEEILNQIESAFNQFSLATINGFKSIEISKKELRKFVYDFSFRNFNSSQKNILNIEELTSIYHFPTIHTKTPHIKAIKSRVAAPPIDLPQDGTNLIGEIIFRGEEKNVYLATREDRRRHFYIIGQTGTGKSSFLSEMIRQDIEAGEGVGVIDPHGDLIETTLSHIPKERIEDVVLFEPFDMERPVGLNMLECDSPEQKDFAIQEMIAIFYKLFPPEIIGPMFEHYMRNAMLAIMADKNNPGTLVEIPRMFTDDKFMEDRLVNVTDPIVRSFWLKEWKQITGNTKSDILGYVVSKVGRFIENEMMRNIIGQSYSGFDLAKIMNEKKIFLANLSKGQTGEVNSSLLGLILVSKIQMAAMRRANVLEEERKDFYLYIDEFQNFTTDSIVTILSEARKYRLNLTLAHQYISQLTDPIKGAVLGNVGTLSSFRIGADDAEYLEKQFEPEFSRFDLVNLDNFNLIIKLMINNKISSPFKLKINYPQKGDLGIIEPIKKISKLKYGRSKEIVEREIIKRAKLGEF